jgi:hypothetical protein
MRLGLFMVTALMVPALGTVSAAVPQKMRVEPRCSVEGKESKNDRGFVKLWIEVKGQLSSIPDLQENDSHGGFVRVGDGFGMQVFSLDWSEAPELREQARKLPFKWVVVTGRLKSSGPNYVGLGYSGTVTVKTLKRAGPPSEK